MFCPQCGDELGEGDAFCGSCGTRVGQGQSSSRVSPPIPPPAPPAAPAPTTPPQAQSGYAVVPASGPSALPTGALYPKAPSGARLLAFVADGLVASAVLPLGLLLVYAGAVRERASIPGFLLLGVGALWQLAYTLGRDGFGGAGVGKRLAGLVVTSNQTGAPAGLGASFVRQIVFYALNMIPVIGSLIEPILVVTDASGRRLGDKAAKTQVARSTDVAARAGTTRAPKTAAVVTLVAAVLVWIAGTAIGGFAFASAIGDVASGGIQPSADAIVSEQAPVTDAPAEEPQSLTEQPAPEQMPPTAPAQDPSEAGGLDPENATDAVGTLLTAMQNDDVEGMKAAATQNFKDVYPEFFYGAAGALSSFEIVDVFQDAAIYVVVVREDWISGPEEVMYFVVWEEGRALVDGRDFN